MKKLFINKSSEEILQTISKNLPQSILLTGPDGIGLSTVARGLVSKCNLTPSIILPGKDEVIDIEKGVISVDSIRRLYDETKTKSKLSRIILIDYAERMTLQAQNAFLKLLEEPGKDVHFILVSHTLHNLLPTIISRVVKVKLKPISNTQSGKLLDQLDVSNEKKRVQLLFMANGLPAELTRLATDEEYFNKRGDIVRDARELLGGNMYKKLLIAQKYRDKRSNALILLKDASNILKKTVSDNPNSEAINKIEPILTVNEQIKANGNIRLCLARLTI